MFFQINSDKERQIINLIPMQSFAIENSGLYHKGRVGSMYGLLCTDSTFNVYYMYYMMNLFLVYFQGLFICNQLIFLLFVQYTFRYSQRNFMSLVRYCHVFKHKYKNHDETIKKYCTLVISTANHLTVMLLRL